MHTPDVVAVFDSSPDNLESLLPPLQQAGFVVVTGFIHDIREGRLDLEAFMRQHDPAVIVWDISVPYEGEWRFLQHIKERQACGRCRFVVTTTNVAEVAKIAGADQNLQEIIGKPYDVGELVRAVKEAARERPTR